MVATNKKLNEFIPKDDKNSMVKPVIFTRKGKTLKIWWVSVTLPNGKTKVAIAEMIDDEGIFKVSSNSSVTKLACQEVKDHGWELDNERGEGWLCTEKLGTELTFFNYP